MQLVPVAIAVPPAGVDWLGYVLQYSWYGRVYAESNDLVVAGAVHVGIDADAEITPISTGQAWRADVMLER